MSAFLSLQGHTSGVGLFRRQPLPAPVPTPSQWVASCDDRVGLLFARVPVPRDHHFSPADGAKPYWQAHSLVASAGRLQYRCEARGGQCDAVRAYADVTSDEVELVQRAWTALGRSREVASAWRQDFLVRAQFDAVLTLVESLPPLLRRVQEATRVLAELADLGTEHPDLVLTRRALIDELVDVVLVLEGTASALLAHDASTRRARALERAAMLSSDAEVVEALAALRSALEGHREVLEHRDQAVSSRAEDLQALL